MARARLAAFALAAGVSLLSFGGLLRAAQPWRWQLPAGAGGDVMQTGLAEAPSSAPPPPLALPSASPPGSSPASPTAARQRGLVEGTAARTPGPPGAGYLPPSALEQRPVVLRDVDPALPSPFDLLAPRELDLLLLISELGDVERVLLLRGELPDTLLEALGRHFSGARFAPGRAHGRAVPVALPIRLEIEGGG